MSIIIIVSKLYRAGLSLTKGSICYYVDGIQPPRLNHHSRLNVSSGCCGDCSGDQQSTFPGRRRPSTSPSGIFIHHHHGHHHGHQGSAHRLSPGLPFYGSGMMSGSDPYQRPRQNSVVVFATAHFMTAARRVKSAMDLQTLVLREETEESVHALSCTGGTDGVGTNKSGLTSSASDCDNHGTITCV